MRQRQTCSAVLIPFGVSVLTILAGSARALAQEAPSDGDVRLSAAGARVTVQRATGRVTSIRLGRRAEEMVRPHPAGSERPFAFVEVVDGRDGRTYNAIKSESVISGWKLSQTDGAKAVSFRQQYHGAPFRIDHTISESPVGIRWEASLRLAADQKLNRSVQVAWMLPLPFRWRFWGPNDTVAHRTDGVTPYRFVYGHTDPRGYGTLIPLVGAWGRYAGAAVFSPPDVRKVQIMFDVYTQNISDPARGMLRGPEDLQMLRVAHHLVGLRPGTDLRLAVCLAGTRPDWRSVMGHYVTSYPELFEPIPAARKFEGMYGITNMSRLSQAEIKRLKARGVTCLEVHAHFPEYGIYVTPEALKNPALTWRCKPHPGKELSLAGNRRTVAQAAEAELPLFMYFYNVHANRETIRRRFASDLVISERGRPVIQYRGEPALRAQPDSPFGRHLIEQMDLMIRAYPKAPGFFVDNFVQQMLSFAHDDGVTMVHNRPAYDMNRNHQDVGRICIEKAHQAGKVIMTNKLATIESARGVDMVLIEGMSVQFMKMHAFACVYRAFFPLHWNYPRGPHYVERCMQHLLIWGGTPAETLYQMGRSDLLAYRPLTDAMIGKRWVFDPDPLKLPAGFGGQIFRIDKSAPRGGSVVVTVVDLSRCWRDKKFTEGHSVVVRLPEADQLKKATWLAVEKSRDKPQDCPIERRGQEITVKLPPVGAAGVLRLSR